MCRQAAGYPAGNKNTIHAAIRHLWQRQDRIEFKAIWNIIDQKVAVRAPVETFNYTLVRKYTLLPKINFRFNCSLAIIGESTVSRCDDIFAGSSVLLYQQKLPGLDAVSRSSALLTGWHSTVASPYHLILDGSNKFHFHVEENVKFKCFLLEIVVLWSTWSLNKDKYHWTRWKLWE